LLLRSKAAAAAFEFGRGSPELAPASIPELTTTTALALPNIAQVKIESTNLASFIAALP